MPTFEAPLPDDVPGNLPGPPATVPEHLDLEWYNSRNVKERDLNPLLLDAQGGDSEHQVLELSVLPAATDTIGIVTPSSWTGITQSISSVGLDLSTFPFLEIWVNDFHPYPFHTDVKGKLHINFGRISEDAFWDPGAIPNSVLDTEDKNGDNKLDRSPIDEDTGLDGLLSVSEPGYTGSGSDPNGDDYFYDPDRPNDYSGINNMEGNGVGDPAALPDTEDLSRDGFADFHNSYFEAVIDLADTSRFVSVDVVRDYAALEAAGMLEHPISPLNGWRLYRLPINSDVFRASGFNPSWANIQHVRMWVNGAQDRLKLQIGGIELLDSLGRATPRTPIVHQNAPNPFNPGTTIRFELPDPGRVRLRVYDAQGRMVRTLLNDDRPSGYHAVLWNGEDDSGRRVASGVYWCRIELPGVSAQTRKMVLAR